MLKPWTDFIQDEGDLFDSHQFGIDMHIHSCHFDQVSFSPELFDLFHIPFPQSLNKAVVKRQAEYLAGRYCAKQVLQQVAPSLNDFNLKIGENRAPQWPDQIHGSISHSNSQAIAIASRSRGLLGLGIDLEETIHRDTIEDIQSQIIDTSEAELISKQHDSKDVLFTAVFSLKESFFKAAYPIVNQYFDFSAISITNIDSRNTKIEFRLNRDLHRLLPQGRTLSGQFHTLPNNMVITFVALGKE